MLSFLHGLVLKIQMDFCKGGCNREECYQWPSLGEINRIYIVFIHNAPALSLHGNLASDLQEIFQWLHDAMAIKEIHSLLISEGYNCDYVVKFRKNLDYTIEENEGYR